MIRGNTAAKKEDRHMKFASIFAFAALACGAPVDDLFPEPAGDAEFLLGQTAQAMSFKASPTYTTGYDPLTLVQCRFSPAPSNCLVAGRTTVRWKLDGTDACGSTSNISWRYQVERAVTESARLQAIGAGYNWPFVSVEDNVTPSITFQRGACPGSVNAVGMKSFVCIYNTSAPSVTLTESLPGNYTRHNGTLTIHLDVDKMWQRAAPGVPVGNCPPSSLDLHELVEHAAHLATMYPFGSGMAAGAVFGPNGLPAWSHPNVEPCPVGCGSTSRYTAANYPVGQLCRIGNFTLGQPTNELIQQSGTCAD